MYVKRALGKWLLELHNSYPMIALVGPRQSGKTTLLKELMKDFASSYVLFDDPDIRSLFNEDIKKFEVQHIEGNDLTVLDEIQYCSDAGSKLKYLVDSNRKLWITSSSEMMLSKEVLSYLVGRTSILRLYPFSFDEFLDARKQKAMTDQIQRRMVWEHLIYGGYPNVVLAKTPRLKKKILEDLYETMLLKDVSRIFSISDIDSLERLARYLAVNIGNPVSYDSISRDLGISFPTLKKYIDALEKSYLILRIRPYFSNKTKELTKQPKVYFLDTGMRNRISGGFPHTPEGRVFENYVLTELVKAGMKPKYWRTKAGAEVDFVIELENELIPIEVKLRASPPKIERSLRSFINAYQASKAFVVHYEGKEEVVEINGCEVEFCDCPKLVSRLRDE